MPPLAVNVTVVPAQMVISSELIRVGTGKALTIIVTALDVAGFPVTHAMEEVITTVTTLLFARVVDVNAGLSVPTFAPLTFHWYDGVAPPFTGVAVKVTEVPEQIVCPGEAAIETLTGTVGVTCIVNVLEVAGLPVTQGAVDVIATVTASLFWSVDDVKFALLVPAAIPLTLHW